MVNVFEESPQFLKDFLIYSENIQGKSPNTIMNYFFDLRMFFRFLKIKNKLVNSADDFETIPINDVSVDLIRNVGLSDLYEYMAFVNRERKNDTATRSRKVASLRTFYKYLTTKVGLLKDNPAKELESPKQKKSLPKYLTLDEAKRLLSSVGGKFPERDLCIFTLFLNCGLRVAELVSINVNDIKNDTLTVVGKGNKERTIYLNKACQSAIANYQRVRPVEGVKDQKALFISARHQRLTKIGVQTIVKDYIVKAGLDPERISTHKLRHTAATLMYRYGDVDVRILQEILGHKNLSTTEIYTHVDNSQLKEAAKKNPLSGESD